MFFVIDNTIILMAALPPPSIGNKDVTSFIYIYTARAPKEAAATVHYWPYNGRIVIDTFCFCFSPPINCGGGGSLNKIVAAVAVVENQF